MGARLSQPRGPGGESSVPARVPPPPSPKRPIPRHINRRTIMAPAAAFTMALLLFVYTRTSIRAAKANAQRHRDVDSGGEGLSLLNEHRRRHGLAKKVDGDGGGTVVELGRAILGGAKAGGGGDGDVQAGRTEEEERERLLKMRMARRSGDEAANIQTDRCNQAKTQTHHQSPNARVERSSDWAAANRSNHWKLDGVPRIDDSGWSEQDLKQEIERVGGSQHCVSSTGVARLQTLAQRTERGLRCYDGFPEDLLGGFCEQGGTTIPLQRSNSPEEANKLVFIGVLEKTEKEATCERFMDLPAELRLLVYEYRYRSFNDHCKSRPENSERHRLLYLLPPPISQVRSLARSESLLCCYQSCRIIFEINGHDGLRLALEPEGVRYLEKISEESLAMMQHLKVKVHSYEFKRAAALHIDVGVGRDEPRLKIYGSPKDDDQEIRFEPRIRDFVLGMAGRAKDQKLLIGDFHKLAQNCFQHEKATVAAWSAHSDWA